MTVDRAFCDVKNHHEGWEERDSSDKATSAGRFKSYQVIVINLFEELKIELNKVIDKINDSQVRLPERKIATEETLAESLTETTGLEQHYQSTKAEPEQSVGGVVDIHGLLQQFQNITRDFMSKSVRIIDDFNGEVIKVDGGVEDSRQKEKKRSLEVLSGINASADGMQGSGKDVAVELDELIQQEHQMIEEGGGQVYEKQCEIGRLKCEINYLECELNKTKQEVRKEKEKRYEMLMDQKKKVLKCIEQQSIEKIVQKQLLAKKDQSLRRLGRGHQEDLAAYEKSRGGVDNPEYPYDDTIETLKIAIEILIQSETVQNSTLQKRYDDVERDIEAIKNELLTLQRTLENEQVSKNVLVPVLPSEAPEAQELIE